MSDALERCPNTTLWSLVRLAYWPHNDAAGVQVILKMPVGFPHKLSF